MIIKLQDRSAITSYIQIVMRDQFGVSLQKLSESRYKTGVGGDIYQTSMNDPIKVTGVYNLATYESVALFMSFNYPNEQFPYIWYRNEQTGFPWVKIPFDKIKLISSMNAIFKWKLDRPGTTPLTPIGDDELTKEVYDEDIIGESDDCLIWDNLIRYFSPESSGSKVMISFINTKAVYEGATFTDNDYREVLIQVIVNNEILASSNQDIVSLDSRILSYIFGEVISELSEEDEIFRVQKLMYYPTISHYRAGKYDELMVEDVKKVQSEFLGSYSEESDFPPSYTGFKVTGYVDPWTERLLVARGGDQS